MPSPAEEAIRDLVRVREDIKDDRRTTQHRVKGFLLRQGRRYPGRDKGWSDKFDLWARAQRFEEPAADAAYPHYLAALDVRRTQLATITTEIEDAAQLPPLAEPVAKLRCLRGIETLSAVSITAEVCDFRRFPRAPSFMAFTGLVPSEHSSGPSGASWLDHQDRQHARASRARRGSLELPAPPSHRHQPAPAERGSASRGPGLRMGGTVSALLSVPFHRLDEEPQRRRRRGREGALGVRLGTHDQPPPDSMSELEVEQAHPPEGSSRTLCEFRSAPVSQRQPPSEPVNCGPDPRIREWSIAAATCLLVLTPHPARPP